jgi:hypothetical protein
MFPLYLKPSAPAQVTPINCSLVATAHASRPLPITETLAGLPGIILDYEPIFPSQIVKAAHKPAPHAARALARLNHHWEIHQIGGRRLLRFNERKSSILQPSGQPELVGYSSRYLRRIVQNPDPSNSGFLQARPQDDRIGRVFYQDRDRLEVAS